MWICSGDYLFRSLRNLGRGKKLWKNTVRWHTESPFPSNVCLEKLYFWLNFIRAPCSSFCFYNDSEIRRETQGCTRPSLANREFFPPNSFPKAKFLTSLTMTWMRYSSLMATNVLSIFPAFPCAFQPNIVFLVITTSVALSAGKSRCPIASWQLDFPLSWFQRIPLLLADKRE